MASCSAQVPNFVCLDRYDAILCLNENDSKPAYDQDWGYRIKIEVIESQMEYLLKHQYKYRSKTYTVI